MASSWSCPKADWPFGAITPMTLKGTLRTRIVWSSGSLVAEEVARDRAAEEHDDLAAPDLLGIEARVRSRPPTRGRSKQSRSTA